MTIRIPIAKPELGEAEWTAVREVIESGWVTQGPKVAAFEQAVAAYCGAANAVAVSSCTTALHLTLACLGVGRGDEVIVPSMSFIATANAVMHAGGTPVFAEVDPTTFNLSIDDAEGRITRRTKAIVLVHQLGLPADIDAFSALTRSRGLTLIEDAACAIGSRQGGRPIGGHGNPTCFSFHPRKVITTGDGGMIVTDSAELAARARLLRQHAMSISDTVRHASDRVVHESYPEVGYNFRLTDVQAAMGLAQLERLPEMLIRRKALAANYDKLLQGQPSIALPTIPNGAEWNVQSYAVRLELADRDTRDRIMQRLLERGIATRPGVMTAHREPAYASAAQARLPVSERASDTSLILPLYNSMSKSEIEDVTESLTHAVDAEQRVG